MRRSQDYIPEGISPYEIIKYVNKDYTCPICDAESLRVAESEWVKFGDIYICYGCSILISYESLSLTDKNDPTLEKLSKILEIRAGSCRLRWLDMLKEDTFKENSMNSWTATELENVRRFIDTLVSDLQNGGN